MKVNAIRPATRLAPLSFVGRSRQLDKLDTWQGSVRPLAEVTAVRLPVDRALRLERMAALGRLYSAVKHFHPDVVSGKILWDSLVKDGIREIGEGEELSPVLEKLLAGLADPATRVRPAPGPAPSQSRIDWTPAGTLIVRVGSGRSDQWVRSEVFPILEMGEGVVFDFRGTPPEVAEQFAGSQLLSLLTDETVLAPGVRRREHVGFRPDGRDWTYNSKVSVSDGSLIAPSNSAIRLTPVFVFDEESAVPAPIVGLQQAGKAVIVGEGPLRGTGLVTPLELRPDLTVEVRTGDYQGPGGQRGVHANLSVPPGSPDTERIAVELARGRPAPTVSYPRFDETPAQPKRPIQSTFPPVEERVLAVYDLWDTMKLFNPQLPLLDQPWDEALLPALDEVERAQNALEYHTAIARMAARLQDAHVVTVSQVLAPILSPPARPPALLDMIEGKPTVVEVEAQVGLQRGDLILAVDGQPASERLEELSELLSAGRPDRLMDLAVNLLWGGAAGSPVEVVVKRDGRILSLDLERSSPTSPRPVRPTHPVLQELEGGLLYVDLAKLTPEQVPEVLERLERSRGGILDGRGYPESMGAWRLAKAMVRRGGVPFAHIGVPLRSSPDQHLMTSELERLPEPPAESPSTPTVMLVHEGTQSHAEWVGMMLQAANGTRLVGTPTSGADGSITWVSLAGGLRVTFTGMLVTYPDGRQTQRVGLQPDLVVSQTRQGIREGRDEVLEAAIALLNEDAT